MFFICYAAKLCNIQIFCKHQVCHYFTTQQNADEQIDISDKVRRRPLKSTEADASPGRLSRKETNSIFDELINQLNEVSEELDHPLSPSSDRRSSSAEGGASSLSDKRASQEPVDLGEMVDTIDVEEISETVDLDEIIDTVDSGDRSGRPMSTLSEQTDMFSSLPRPPQARSVSRTESLSSATLPKKSRGKWLHRVGSPLLKSRKSFIGSPKSKHRNSKVRELKEEGEGEGERGKAASSQGGGVGEKKKGSRRLFARKRSLPEIHTNSASSTPATTPTFQRTSSTDNVPLPHGEPSVTSFDNQTNQSSKLSPLLSPPLTQASPPTTGRVGSRSSDPVTNSLELMVTLSRNKECLSTLVSYICMPKCEAR